MSDSAQEFDKLLDAFLQQGAGSDKSRQSEEMPTEAGGEDLQLLAIALQIRAQFTPAGPHEDFRHNSEIRLKNRLQARINRSARSSKSPRRSLLPDWRRILRPLPLVASLLLVLALALGSIGVVGASAASLPGDALYPIKRGWETARLAISLSNEGDAQLLAAFAGERVEEIETLINLDRYENLGEAIQSYLDLTGQLGELSGDEEVLGESETLSNNIEVLQGVLEKVPAEAQPAIQRVLERSLERAQSRQQNQQQQGSPGQGQGKSNGTPGQGQGLEQDIQTAQQIADQYENVTAEQVREQFEGPCEKDWQCVRRHFRELEQNQRFADQIARQNGITAEAVMQIFEGSCGFDWKCVRAHFQQKGGPPEGVGPNN